jgi:hypothetical protein
MNYTELSQTIQNYSENNESLFVASIPTFVKEAERRIYNSVQIPALRKNVTGTMTASNKYVSLPNDWLANYSLAVIDSTGSYHYLLNKDVNYIREAYPSPTSVGQPKHYALFGSQYTDLNELSLIVGPTPNDSYDMELHYFYYPVSIVQGQANSVVISNAGSGFTNGTYANVSLLGGSGSGATATFTVVANAVSAVVITDAGVNYAVGDILTISQVSLGGSGTNFNAQVTTTLNPTGTSWLGDNYDPVLLYGAMREAIIFMKGEADMVGYYEKMYQESLSQLNRLGTGLERNDSYRAGQASIKVNP